jgi:hypothetical protein
MRLGKWGRKSSNYPKHLLGKHIELNKDQRELEQQRKQFYNAAQRIKPTQKACLAGSSSF